MDEEKQQATEMQGMDRLLTPLNIGVGGIVAGGIIDLAVHGGWPGMIFATGASLVLAKQSPILLEGMKDGLKEFLPTDLIEQVTRREPGKRSLYDRAMGFYPEEEPLRKGAAPKWDEMYQDDGEEEAMMLPAMSSELFTFSQLLESGFIPSINKIFVGRTMEGKNIFVAAEDLCHVAFAGRTGGGKGSLMRLIMVQLCAIGAQVLLLNPHYMRWVCAKDGASFDEDWTPFEGLHPRRRKPYLMQSPLECADYRPIGHYLQWTVTTLLEQRKAKGREGGQRFKPFFLVIDEWPSISSEIKEAPDLLAKILREGRKYGIFVIIASQDFQARTLRMESGSVRKCFLTVFYTGGDLVSVKELLNDKVQVNENDLGKGVVLLRCSGTGNQPMLARVPFVDNNAVYRLLGPSTFKVETEKVETEELEDLEDLRIDVDATVPTLPHSPRARENERTSEHESAIFSAERGNSGNGVNEPVKTFPASGSGRESSPAIGNAGEDSPGYSHAEEVQVLLAYGQLLQAGRSVTRTGIREHLGWSNRQYERIIKPVCDKHHIG